MNQEALYKESVKSALQQKQLTVEADRKPNWRDFIEATKTGIVKSNVLSAVIGLWLGIFTIVKTGASITFIDGLFLFLATLIGTAFVVASGCVFNNYLDRDLDAKMERTKERPSVRLISPKVLLVYGTILGAVGTLVLGIFANWLAAALGLAGIFFYVIVYTALMKRTSTLNTVVGCISGAVPPMIGWCAVTGTLDTTAWMLFLFLFFWQPPHFLALAMRREKEYREAGFKMLPSVSGFKESKWQILLWVAALIPLSLLLYALPVLGYLYLIAALVLGGIYLYYAIQGFLQKAGDDNRWAGKMFGYSLVYLTAMYGVMFIDAMF